MNTVLPNNVPCSVPYSQTRVPAGYTFGQMHDELVTNLTNAGVPDWLANIPSMIPEYIAAIDIEIMRSTGILPQPNPDARCK